MQNAIFTISHFQVSGSLDIKKRKKKTTSVCWLFVCCLFLLIPPPLWKQPLPHPLICLPHVFGHSSVLSHARARTQTQADEPSVRQDEPCHEPQTDIMLTLRPSSNHLSPACCATPLDSKLRHTFAIPSRTVFCQHWATLFPHFSKPRAHVGYEIGPGTKCATICFVWTWAVAHLLLSENPAGCYKEGRYHLFPETFRFTVTLLRNAIIQSIFNTSLHFWSETPISAKLHRD